MRNHGTTPDEPEPRRPADAPPVPAQRQEDKDMQEIQDPYDLPFPDLSDRWPPRRPDYVIVVDQIRGSGQPPCLAELLDTTAARTREPEPDREAEP